MTMLMYGPSHVLVLAMLPSIQLAEAQSTDLFDDPLAGAPICAIECFFEAANHTTERNPNHFELCTDKGFFLQVQKCARQDCNVTETLDFLNTTHVGCRMPATDRRREVQITCLAASIVALISFIMRAVSKVIGFVPYGNDDALILAAFPIVVILNVFCQFLPSKGLGLDIWAVSDEDITTFLIYQVISEISYILSLCLIKLSILAFYLRILPNKTFQIVVFWTMSVVVIITIIYVVIFATQRIPLRLVWEGWKEKVPRGVTFDATPMVLSNGILNVIVDVWMLILPITQLYKIGLKPKKKIGVLAMFGVGVFLTIVSALRIPSLTIFQTSWNVTVDSVGIIIWSNIEICVGVIVACMPGVRQCVRDIMFRVRRGREGREVGADDIFIDRSLATIEQTRLSSSETARSSTIQNDGTLICK